MPADASAGLRRTTTRLLASHQSLCLGHFNEEADVPEGWLASACDQLRHSFCFINCWQDLLDQDTVLPGFPQLAPLLLVLLPTLRDLPPRSCTAGPPSEPYIARKAEPVIGGRGCQWASLVQPPMPCSTSFCCILAATLWHGSIYHKACRRRGC